MCPVYHGEVTGSACVDVSESVHMCKFVVNPVGNLKLVALKVICVIKQRKKKGNVYSSLLTHILEILAILLPSVGFMFIYCRSRWCRATVKYDFLPLSLNL